MRSAGVRVYGFPIAVLGVLALTGALVQACAAGDTTTDTPEVDGGLGDGAGKDTGSGDAAKDTGAVKDTGVDVILFEAGPNDVPIGQSCKAGDTCALGGKCQEITPGKSFCTIDCGTGCPAGSYCSTIGGKTLCAPDVGNECMTCVGSVDCPIPTDQCVTAPKGDKFCARDCSVLDDCPTGFTCVDAAGYPGSVTGGGDAGVDSGGSGGARICVPAAGDSCGCDAKRDGVQRTCSIANTSGTCSGTEHCTASKTAWEGCDARTPAVETCNGVDDDCNGKIDDGKPNDLCSPIGGPPPNAVWACSTATTPPTCQLGACAAGWSDYPAKSNPATGCACKVDAAEPNDTCAKPTNLGTVSDATATAVVAAGTLSGDADVDVFVFTATNTVTLASGPNGFHVGINFDAAGNPGGEFVFDVVHGGTCTDTAASNHAALTSYTWCVDGSATVGGAIRGEAPCGATGIAHCSDHSSAYYVHVRRKPGAPPTCNGYKINITAKGGAACDFAGTQCESPAPSP
jgi:hypothetical protein